MINVSKLPLHLLHDLGEFVQNNTNVRVGDERDHIALMSVNEAFDAYLKWTGIIGFTERITEVLDAIRAAEVKPEAKPELIILDADQFSEVAFVLLKEQFKKAGKYLGNWEEEMFGKQVSATYVLYVADRQLTKEEARQLIKEA